MTQPKRKRKGGVSIDVNAESKIRLAHAVMTRPQDWNPVARAILWPELANRVMERAAQRQPQPTGSYRR